MKVQALIDALSLQPFHLARPQEEITGLTGLLTVCEEFLDLVLYGVAWRE